MRNARSRARATSRCEIHRILPNFVYCEPDGKRSPALHDWLPTATGFVPRNRTGASPPLARSWPVPWLPPGGRHRRRHDVFEGVVGTHPAVVAGSPPTIGEPMRGQGRLPVLPQEVLVETGRDVVPRQDLVLGAVAGHVPVGVETLGVHRIDPAVELEPLAPLLERPARSPDAFDDPADPAVTAARDPLGERCRRVVPLHLGPSARGTHPARD